MSPMEWLLFALLGLGVACLLGAVTAALAIRAIRDAAASKARTLPEARVHGKRRWWQRKRPKRHALWHLQDPPHEDVRPTCQYYPNCPKRKQLYGRGSGCGPGPTLFRRKNDVPHEKGSRPLAGRSRQTP
jgi:hypothetical protein